MNQKSDQLVAVLDEIGLELFTLISRVTLSETVAEELLQQLVLKLIERPKSLEKIANLNGYVRRAAIHSAFTWRRDQKIRRSSPLPENLVADVPSALDVLAIDEEARVALELLDELPAASREVVAMHYLDEQSYAEIATTLNKSTHQVRSLCSKGIRSLRMKLQSKVSRNVEDSP